MLFCTNCKLMVIYNPGYCPSCGILFVHPHQLSEEDRLKAEQLSTKWTIENKNPHLNNHQHSNQWDDTSYEDSSLGASKDESMYVHPGRKRLPRGLISTIISILVVLILSIGIYLLTS